MTEQLKIIIAAEIDKFKQNVNDAKKKIKDFIKEGTKDFSALNDEFQKVGDSSKKFLAVSAGAVAGAATALLALGNSTKEYRQQQAMLATAFETAGGSAEGAKKTYNELYRVLGDSGQATEAAQHLAKLTTEEKSLSEWTNICQGVYAQFGESLPIESLTEAVNHTAKVGEVQGALADALEWSGVNMDEFNEQLFWCNSESEREKLIRDTLNGVYSDAAAAYETNNAQVLAQNDAQAKLTESMAKLGEATAPIMTMLAELGAQILADLTPYIEEFAQKYLPDISEALSKVGEAIGKVIAWIADNWELVSTLAAIVLGIAAALSVFSTVMGIVNAVMAASPVTWIVLAIVAAIAALVAIIVVVIKYWDEIKGFTVRTWEAIKNAISTAIGAIKGAVQTGFAWIKDKIITPIQNAFNSVKTTFSNIVSTIKEKLNLAKETVRGIIEKIKGFFKFEWSLPKLKVPKFSITPSGWGIGDLLKGVIPKLGITWNARGGVFDKPTLFNYGNSLQGIGENGAEAVVPLENNLEWLNKLADMLGERMGAGTPIVLQVDGKTFAQTSINTINKLTKQNGKLGLNII
jgi:phage-related protein